jgi:hypothetical protein
MTYEDFKKMCEDSMENAIKMYGDETTGPMVIDEGIDTDCEAFIMSPEYIL